MQVVNLDELKHQELTSAKNQTIYSQSAVLSDFFKFQAIFVHHEILAPGRMSSAPHRHSLREEMILVLKGEALCHFGDERVSLRKGDVVGFELHSQALHCIENTSREEVHLLVISSNPQKDEVIYV